ncbi:MAG: cytochrome c, partial [Flavobacterium sp.]
MKFIWTTLFLSLLASCKSEEGNLKLLSQNNLKIQTFSFRTDKDTSLITQGGIIIKLKAGDIESFAGNVVKVNIKEALSITEMIKAGLYTMSDGRPLSSGGMFSIDVENRKDLKIKRAISAFVPTTLYNSDMSVFSGHENDNSVNWTKPEKLSEDDEVQSRIRAGKDLFESSCGNCHKIDKDFAGPSLMGITDRLPKRWLYDFTRNPAAVWDNSASKTNNILALDNYTCCMVNEWKPLLMTPFPELSDNDLENIYSFVKSESEKIGFGKENTISSRCFNCAFPGRNAQLADDSGVSYLSLSRTIVVNSDTITGTFYSLKIDAFGWYNIDILLDDLQGCSPSELIVDNGGRSNENVRISLVIPAIRIFSYAYPDKASGKFVFSKDGATIPLPRSEKCYILSYSQLDENSVEYSLQRFTAAGPAK